ncbi:MAG: ABC transporter permease [Candidatus Thermoplasmatota archaeon]
MRSFKSDIIGDISNTYLSVKFELMKHMRRKRLLIAVSLAIIIPLIFYAIPKIWDVGFADSAGEFASDTLGYINLLIIISGAIFAGDAISGEFEKKTGLLLFPTPQRRTSIFVGKYIAALIATFFVLSLYYGTLTLEITQIYGVKEIPVDLATSYLISLIYATSVLSVIYFFSSILKRTISSTLLGFFFLMMILPITERVLKSVDVEPWFVVTYSAGLITDVFRLPTNVAFGPGERLALTGFAPDFYVGIWVMMAYKIVLFLVSIAIANRKNME